MDRQPRSNRNQLSGLWAALCTPWRRDGRLDEAALAGNVAKLAAAGVDGVYTTDSDGEFYAIELEEFQHLAQTFGAAVRHCNVPASMGVTWSDTAGIIRRIEAACEAGISLVHVGFPFFMELTAQDAKDFWADLARAVPGAKWVHYAHPRCGPVMTARDYRWLADEFPNQFVGTKLTGSDVLTLAALTASTPEIAHFVGDRTLATGYWLGARGCYSYWVNTLPAWQKRYCEICAAGDWSTARVYFDRLEEWERTAMQPLRDRGYRHAALAKARAALSGWLDDSGALRAPYQPILPTDLDRLKKAFDEYWRTELAQEAFPRPGIK